MGRGNVCVTGSYEGLFYIDNDDLRVYRKDGPGTDDCEDRLQRDLDYADITGPDWYLDEVGSSYEEEDVLESMMMAAPITARSRWMDVSWFAPTPSMSFGAMRRTFGNISHSSPTRSLWKPMSLTDDAQCARPACGGLDAEVH